MEFYWVEHSARQQRPLTEQITVFDGPMGDHQPHTQLQRQGRALDKSTRSAETASSVPDHNSANRLCKHLSAYITSVHTRISIDSWVAQLEHTVPHVWGQQVHARLLVLLLLLHQFKTAGRFHTWSHCQGIIHEPSLHSRATFNTPTPQTFDSGLRLAIKKRDSLFE